MIFPHEKLLSIPALNSNIKRQTKDYICKTRMFIPKPPSSVFKITFAGGLIPPSLNP